MEGILDASTGQKLPCLLRDCLNPSVGRQEQIAGPGTHEALGNRRHHVILEHIPERDDVIQARQGQPVKHLEQEYHRHAPPYEL